MHAGVARQPLEGLGVAGALLVGALPLPPMALRGCPMEPGDPEIRLIGPMSYLTQPTTPGIIFRAGRNGGPQVAIVSGRVRGHRVWARLSRGDGCQMERWDRIPSLLPAGRVR